MVSSGGFFASAGMYQEMDSLPEPLQPDVSLLTPFALILDMSFVIQQSGVCVPPVSAMLGNWSTLRRGTMFYLT